MLICLFILYDLLRIKTKSWLQLKILFLLLGAALLGAGVIGAKAGLIGAGVIGAKAGLVGGALAAKALHGRSYGGYYGGYSGYGGFGGGYGYYGSGYHGPTYRYRVWW